MAGSNQRRSGVFISNSLRIFVIITLIRRWIINFPQYQIIILRGVLGEVYEVLRERPGGEGVVVLVLLPHGRHADDHKSNIPYFLPLDISRIDGIYYKVIIILELESPILM